MSENVCIKPTILVIEDDAFIQAILHQTLGDNFNTTILSDGMEALNYLKKGSVPDIILSDLNVPGIDGLTLLQQVRKIGLLKSVPFYILSGKEDAETKIYCLEAGADDYLIKPFNPRELDARIKNILRRMGKIN